MLDQVNNANRSTVVCSGPGPLGVPIHLRADGIAIFEFDKVDIFSGGAVDSHYFDGEVDPKIKRQEDERERLRDLRYRYMDAFRTCFHVAANRSAELTPPSSRSHYIWARKNGSDWQMMDNGQGFIQPLPFFQDPISEDVLRSALSSFRNADGRALDARLDTLSLFYRAAFNMNHHEYQSVVILGWAIIEGCQDKIWERFVAGGYKKVNPRSEISGKRRKLLLTDRNYTAAIKSQVLALTDQYLDRELDLIDRVRKRRNSFMHSLEPVDVGDAFDAMHACSVVAKKALDLTLQPFGNPGGWDYKR